MATVQMAPPSCLVLFSETWQTYIRLLRMFDERPNLRITYDRGTLEIMTLSPEHENAKHRLGRLVVAATEELGLPIAGYGSMTIKRRRKRRGLEPDECYWIANEHLVRGKMRFDFRVDPPPDLVIEVDITSSSLDRMAIYAALGVPEVWQFNGQTLAFHVLGFRSQYTTAGNSRALPLLTAGEVLRFLTLFRQLDENAVVQQFRAWLRQQITAGGPTPPAP